MPSCENGKELVHYVHHTAAAALHTLLLWRVVYRNTAVVRYSIRCMRGALRDRESKKALSILHRVMYLALLCMKMPIIADMYEVHSYRLRFQIELVHTTFKCKSSYIKY